MLRYALCALVIQEDGVDLGDVGRGDIAVAILITVHDVAHITT